MVCPGISVDTRSHPFCMLLGSLNFLHVSSIHSDALSAGVVSTTPLSVCVSVGHITSAFKPARRGPRAAACRGQLRVCEVEHRCNCERAHAGDDLNPLQFPYCQKEFPPQVVHGFLRVPQCPSLLAHLFLHLLAVPCPALSDPVVPR
eukprot:1754589-Rhodomonas_salina.2